MRRSSRVERVLQVVLLLLLAAIAAVLLSTRPSSTSSASPGGSAFDGPTLPPRLAAANFRLTDPGGRAFTLLQYRGKVVVLTFIHSRCRGTCPFMAEQIKGALNLLPGLGRGVPALAISVDPTEDTPRSRRRFLAKYGMAGRLDFLSGSPAALRRVWHAYAMQPVDPHAKVDLHSTFVVLVDKRGYERVGFPADQLTPEELAHDIGVLEREPA